MRSFVEARREGEAAQDTLARVCGVLALMQRRPRGHISRHAFSSRAHLAQHAGSNLSLGGVPFARLEHQCPWERIDAFIPGDDLMFISDEHAFIRCTTHYRSLVY